MGHNADLLRSGLAALDARDLDGFRALIAPDGEMTSPQGTFRGRDEIAGFFRQEHESYSKGENTIITMLEGDSGAAAEVVWRGVNDGTLHTPMGDLPPTGRTVEIPFSLWFTVEAGLVKTAHVYMDAMSFAAQLGLMPGPQA